MNAELTYGRGYSGNHVHAMSGKHLLCRPSSTGLPAGPLAGNLQKLTCGRCKNSAHRALEAPAAIAPTAPKPVAPVVQSNARLVACSTCGMTILLNDYMREYMAETRWQCPGCGQRLQVAV